MRASHNEFRLSFQNSRTPRDILKKHFQSSEFEIKFNGRSASECWRGKFFEERRFVKKDLKSFAQTSFRGFWIFEFLKISDNFRYNFRENRNGHWKWPIFRPKITRVFEKSADRLKYSRWSQDYKFTQFRVFSFFLKSLNEKVQKRLERTSTLFSAGMGKNICIKIWPHSTKRTSRFVKGKFFDQADSLKLKILNFGSDFWKSYFFDRSFPIHVFRLNSEEFQNFSFEPEFAFLLGKSQQS